MIALRFEGSVRWPHHSGEGMFLGPCILSPDETGQKWILSKKDGVDWFSVTPQYAEQVLHRSGQGTEPIEVRITDLKGES